MSSAVMMRQQACVRSCAVSATNSSARSRSVCKVNHKGGAHGHVVPLKQQRGACMMRSRCKGSALTISASGAAYGKSTLDTTIVPQFRRNEKDTGSPEAQIAMWTCRIRQLTEHLKSNKKDYQCSRGLTIMLGKRRKMLEYLYKIDKYDHKSSSLSEKYVDVCEKLGIRQTIKIVPKPR